MNSSEKIGVSTGLIAAMLWGLFPVLVKQGTTTIPPITFAAIAVGFAAIAAFLYSAYKGSLKELNQWHVYKYVAAIAVCIIVLPYTLLSIGSIYTSGTNTSILLLAEIIYTVIFTHFIGEPTTKLKLYGAGGVFIGAVFILYNGTFTLNFGDVLVLLSTATYPIGNFFSKKALHYLSNSSLLFLRSIIAFIFFIAIARFFEPEAVVTTIVAENFWLLLVVGGLLMGLSKILTYESLRHLDISKFIAIAMTFPVSSIIVLILFYGEKITLYHGIGGFFIALGVYFTVKRSSVDSSQTKYAPKHV